MLIDRSKSVLMLVDLQERLLPAIDAWQTLQENVAWMTRVALALNVPILASEQYPKGLGPTVPLLRGLLPEASVGEKEHFSCVQAACFEGKPGADAAHVVLCGVEAHVCVLQTALDLSAANRKVFVVADCVGSRKPADRDIALVRMRDHGVEVVSREMVAFEWLGRSASEEFRRISREFLR